jgi:hypothetical protein
MNLTIKAIVFDLVSQVRKSYVYAVEGRDRYIKIAIFVSLVYAH